MPIYTRHDEVPVFEHRDERLEANLYNRVARRLGGEGPQLRLALPSLRHLDIILQVDAWIVVDRALGDIPLLAWTRFREDPQRRLHGPVASRLRLFHAQAGLLKQRVLDDLAGVLDARLDAEGGGRGQLLRFPGSG